MRSIRKLITVFTGVVVAIVVGAAPAHAATSWTIYGTSGDVVGAHAEGTLEFHSDGRLYVYGTLEDTRSDGFGACLQLVAYYTGSDTPRQDILCNTYGHGTAVYIGPGPGHYRSYAGNVRHVLGREGLRLPEGTIAWGESSLITTLWKK